MKLFRMDYSPYARKVQMVLDLLGKTYEKVDIVYGDRTEMAEASGGWVMVPVLVEDDGTTTVDSRAICERLLRGADGERLVPAPWQGPVWAYADWCDNVLEDVLFRIASPIQVKRFTNAWERGLYVFVKERKFGAGCVTQWERAHDDLMARARNLLAPTRLTLQSQPFVFGDEPTLADAALYGNFAMLETCDASLPAKLGPEFPAYLRRMEQR